tara:strand:+ start:3682 stop:4524 length:843 start_codon:yes stop_codon:yes gene_type:complete
MKVLVTGGAGFIGYNLIKRLIKDNHEVCTFDDYSTGNHEVDGVKYDRYCVYDNYDSWKHEYKDIDVIFHLAAVSRVIPSFTNPWRSTKINVMGTQAVLEFAKDNNCKVVYPASSSLFGGELGSPYAWAKHQGEQLCRLYFDHYGVETTLARFYNVYGPKQPQEGAFAIVMGIFEKQFANGDPLTIEGTGEQRRDFTHVEDVVDGLVKIAELEKMDCSEFELGTGVNHSINEIAKMFGGPTKFIPERPGQYPFTLCKTKEAQEILGWEPQWTMKAYIDSIK